MRLPAMVSLSDLLTPELRTTLKIEELPILGFVIPNVGELSGTERKKLLSEVRGGFGDSGLDLLDVARLRTNVTFAPLADAISSALAASLGVPALSAADLITVVTPKLGTPAMWNYDPQWIYKRVGALRLELGAKFSDKHKPTSRPARMGNIPPPTSNSPGSPTSPCTSGTRRPRPGTPRTIPSPRRTRTTFRPAG